MWRSPKGAMLASTVSLLDHLTPLAGVLRRSEPSPAEAILGQGHPLCRSEREVRSATTQLAGTITFVAALLAFARFHAVGLVVFACVVAVVVVVVRLATALFTRQARSMDAIADGLEDLRLPHVQRVRNSLLGEDRRRRIAAALASHQPRAPSAQAADGAREELSAVIELLRDGAPPSARGVALCQRLLSAYPSPFYASDAGALRRELGRIRFLLLR
jgi:hypothetical protein